MSMQRTNHRLLVGFAGLAVGAAVVPASGQATLEWFATGDGVSFEDPLNWMPNGVPGILDEAKFDEAGFQVINFSSSPSNATASIENDTVVFNLTGQTYTLGELIVGDRNTDIGSLTVNGGILTTTTGQARIGRLGTSHGSLILSDGAQMINDRDLIIGDLARGYFELCQTCSVTSFVAFIADDTTAQGEAIIRGSWTILTSLIVGNTGAGTVTVESGGNVTVPGQVLVGDDLGAVGSLTVDGNGSTVTALGAATVGNFGTGSLAVTNGGLVTVTELKIADDAAGDVLVDGASIIVSVTTTVGDLAAGSLTLANGGSLQSPLVTVGTPGSLEGSGSVAGSVISNGAVRPGAGLGLLSISGDYTQLAGSLNIEIGGTNAGVDHDQLTITGAATLGGTLNLSLVGGYSPSNAQFVILQANSITGSFATVNLPAGFSVSYEPDRVVVSIDAGCVADITGDGLLDLADIAAFVSAFLAQQPPADLAPPAGVFDLADLGTFISAFLAGCP